MLLGISGALYNRRSPSYHASSLLYLPSRVSPRQSRYQLDRRPAFERQVTRSMDPARYIQQQQQQHAVEELISGLSPDIADMMPASLDLDLHNESSLSSGILDTAKLRSAGNTLSELWIHSEFLASQKLASLPLKPWSPGSPALGSNTLTLQCAIFCEQLVAKFEPQRRTGHHLEFYVMAHMSLQVCDDLLTV